MAFKLPSFGLLERTKSSSAFKDFPQEIFFPTGLIYIDMFLPFGANVMLEVAIVDALISFCYCCKNMSYMCNVSVKSKLQHPPRAFDVFPAREEGI